MTKAQFEAAVSAAVSTYDGSAQDQEAKENYLEALSDAVKTFTGNTVINCTSWPC